MLLWFCILFSGLSAHWSLVLWSVDYAWTDSDKQLATKIIWVISRESNVRQQKRLSAITNIMYRDDISLRVRAILNVVQLNVTDMQRTNASVVVPSLSSSSSSSFYSIQNWLVYKDSTVLYADFLKDGDACVEGQFFQKAKNILAENDTYLVLSIESWPCWFGSSPSSYLIDKKDDVAHFVAFSEDIEWDLYAYQQTINNKLEINKYQWRVLWWNRSIAPKLYYEGYNCPECWLQKIWSLVVDIDDLKDFVVESDIYKKLNPTN